ncbi:hypothetical protein RRG08_057392 [Elysia crispata]|uniref:Uncharacterized protein n=1 Tax=Elysia crispata TaxID=231223 RepID=A0AAE1E867_9GAST|nr:hypothetical protein RRG08_057392 [Elysia crispata]
MNYDEARDRCGTREPLLGEDAGVAGQTSHSQRLTQASNQIPPSTLMEKIFDGKPPQKASDPEGKCSMPEPPGISPNKANHRTSLPAVFTFSYVKTLTMLNDEAKRKGKKKTTESDLGD